MERHQITRNATDATAAVSSIEDALRRCGVSANTLSAREQDALDRQGYLLLPGALDAQSLARSRAAFEVAANQALQEPGARQKGTRHIDFLAWQDTAATVGEFFLHPKVLAAVRHVLQRSFKVFLLTGRDPLQGFGQQGLHADWLPRMPSDPWSLVAAFWLLDDFTRDNGATRLVPGSHLRGMLPKPMQTPQARHPEEQLVVAAAGSVLVFNGHLWHSGTRNEAGGPRRILQCQYIARDVVRPGEVTRAVPGHLTPAARYILGA